MNFILGQLQQLGMVALTMTCALGGTVGMIQLIRKFTPGDGRDPLSQRRERRQNREEDET